MTFSRRFARHGRLIVPSADNGALSWTMVNGDRTYSVDANNFLSDGAASYTVSGYAQYAGADGIVDLGGNQNVTVTLPSINSVSSITPQQPRIDAYCVLDVTACSSSGQMVVCVVGSNDPSFGLGNVVMLGGLSFGGAIGLTLLFPNAAATGAPATIGGSRYEIGFTNEQNNQKYEYVKLYNSVISAAPTITYKAFVAVLPEP